ESTALGSGASWKQRLCLVQATTTPMECFEGFKLSNMLANYKQEGFWFPEIYALEELGRVESLQMDTDNVKRIR
ncbi:hypothetical protein L915_07427, partial [Phytophthora nicotianae]